MLDAALAARPAGLVLGRYRPLRPLGSGGSGSVWLARDEQTGRDVALKIVRREGKSGARAEREAELAARLRHERCLRAYGFGTDDEHVYIAYEYTPGRTLREAIRAGSVPDAAAVEAAAQVLEGLAHAHANGVVHRDVKPSNVLLLEGEEVAVRLFDFGLARTDDADTLTAVGDVPGTLAYIAPERLAGEPATPAADVWAVGVLLWEALAGVHPFWTSSLLSTARAIEAGAPPLAEARPDLPGPLLAAVDRALSRDPAKRPSAEKLARALRASVAERRPQARPRPTLPRLPHEERLVAAALAALAAGFGASLLPFFPQGVPFVLAALAAGLAFVRPRAGLALALAAPVLPLGNVALGLAIVYVCLALAWLALTWGEPRAGLLVALGPVLAPLGALAFLPLAVLGSRSAVRRAAAAGAGVLLAVAVAGIRGSPFPLTGGRAPLGLGVAGSDRPAAVAESLWNALSARPELVLEAAVLAAAAAALPYARTRGPWGIAGLGAALMTAALVPAPAVAALPVIAATWATCAVLALAGER